jgi:hypothetical protein
MLWSLILLIGRAKDYQTKGVSMKHWIAIAALLSPGLSFATDDVKLEACRAKLIKAQKLEVLYDLAWQKGSMPKVVAGPTFFTMPIDAKEGFAETVNCFLMVGEPKCIEFDIKHWQTGKSAARWSGCRLKMI